MNRNTLKVALISATVGIGMPFGAYANIASTCIQTAQQAGLLTRPPYYAYWEKEVSKVSVRTGPDEYADFAIITLGQWDWRGTVPLYRTKAVRVWRNAENQSNTTFPDLAYGAITSLCVQGLQSAGYYL
jgi:hypothetical protein